VTEAELDEIEAKAERIVRDGYATGDNDQTVLEDFVPALVAAVRELRAGIGTVLASMREEAERNEGDYYADGTIGAGHIEKLAALLEP
jgi:hypothetical protein